MHEDRTGTMDMAPDAVIDGDDPVDALVVAQFHDPARPPVVVPLTGAELELGRSVEVPGGPLDDPKMSRRHARLVRERGRWSVEDLASRNGVFVGGERITRRTPLTRGDVLRMANTVFVRGRVPSFRDDEGPLIGVSVEMAAVRRQVRQVAPYHHAVLVVGPTGAGKEVVAAAVHAWSQRGRPLVALNCAVLSEGLLESDLFGHRRGAFTGADADRVGLFEQASGSTLFLDEIGELPLQLQAKLLRTLETRRIRPVGGVEEIDIDARVVAATNAPLPERIAAGTFRADLYARLAQWVVTLPPLRERREDIPFLVAHLLERDGTRAVLSVELMEALLRHPWPLNVRGLRNVLAGAVVASGGGKLRLGPSVRHLLDVQLSFSEPSVGPAATESSATTAKAPLPDVETVVETLRTHGGSIAAAARALGCSRQRLYRYVQSHELDLDAIRNG
jgi:DNA-binding NtrC family response regulator